MVVTITRLIKVGLDSVLVTSHMCYKDSSTDGSGQLVLRFGFGLIHRKEVLVQEVHQSLA